jgi:hypothetical protein
VIGRNLILPVALCILASGCSRLTVKTHQEYGEQCTEVPLAAVVDAAALFPLSFTTAVFGVGGMIIMEHNAIGGLLALGSAALTGALTLYTGGSVAYGWRETAKCREAK